MGKCLTTGDPQVSWADFMVVEVFNDKQGTKDYCTDDASVVADIKRARTIVHGFVKWDECCQWWADCVHTDEPEELKDLCELLSSIYEHADTLTL